MQERYWLKNTGSAWRQATQEEFIQAERSAGFRPKSGSGVATGGFGNGSVTGRVTYGEITSKDYGYDSDFLAVAQNSPPLVSI